ncbi:MAG TPA: hypothetical protein VF789_19295 [Thermoanaerobaculia bacterium]
MDLDIALRIVTLFIQALIPVAVFLAGRAIAKAQYSKSAQDTWNEFNKLVLASKENIEVARKYLRPPKFAEEDEEQMRKAYMAFVLLNNFNAFYQGAKHKLLDKTYEQATMHELLAPLLKDDDIYALSQNRGYHPAFREFCRTLRGRPSDAVMQQDT